MPRPPRIEFEGALYHVFSRGNNRQPIFLADEDRRFFLRALEEDRAQFDARIYAYALLTNHFHLLLRTGKPNLARLMHHFLSSYASYFKRHHATEGHVFQGRYQAILCDDEAYLLTLTRYIHLNPVRAGLCAAPEGYPWSSLRAYLDLPRSDPLAVDCSEPLQLIGGSTGYQRFLSDELQAQGPGWVPAPASNILGSREFVESALRKLADAGWPAGRIAPLRRRYLPPGRDELEAAILAACAALGLEPATVSFSSRKRRVAIARGIIGLIATQKAGIPLVQVATRLGVSKGSLSAQIQRVRKDRTAAQLLSSLTQ